MYDMVDKPDRAHQLLRLTTQLTIEWLQAQAEVLGDQAEGLFILDDIVGFIGLEHYEGFAHPYLTQINAVNGEGIILSVGGGTSPGMPRENILAMIEGLEEFNAARVTG